MCVRVYVQSEQNIEWNKWNQTNEPKKYKLIKWEFDYRIVLQRNRSKRETET